MPENSNTVKNEAYENRMPFMCPYMYNNTYRCRADENGWQFGCPYCPFFPGSLGWGNMPYPYARGSFNSIPFPESRE